MAVRNHTPIETTSEKASRLAAEIRALGGFAVTIFGPGDVEERQDPDAFIIRNRKLIEEAMIAAGNQALTLCCSIEDD